MIRGATLIVALMLTVAPDHAQQGLKQFHDAATNVSFSYPAWWKLDATRDAYIPTSNYTGDGSLKRAIVKVGFPGIKNTQLTEVEFVYAMIPTRDEKNCTTLAGDGDKSEWVKIGGVRYWHVAFDEAGMSHWAELNSYATWLSGSCLLFEKGVHGVVEGVADWAHPLSKAKGAAIDRQLDAVMRSVVIGRP